MIHYKLMQVKNYVLLLIVKDQKQAVYYYLIQQLNYWILNMIQIVLKNNNNVLELKTGNSLSTSINGVDVKIADTSLSSSIQVMGRGP